MYRENGFRDAQIINHSVSVNAKNEIILTIDVSEGEKYFFGDIKWIGNSKYNSDKLNELLSIKSNDIFDQTLLEERLYMSRNGNDISSLYMDDGYLFFQANPIEVGIDGQKINLEIRVNEGKRAIVNNVTVTGNTKVKDHVIMREVRSLPGSMFKRSDIIRTIIIPKDSDKKTCLEINKNKYPDLASEYIMLTKLINSLREKLDLVPRNTVKSICAK